MLDRLRVAAEDMPERAVRAAVAVAAEHGVRAADPVVLTDHFNVVVWLCPAPVVARVVLLPALLREVGPLIAREVEVADFLAERGAPAVRTSPLLPPGPHARDGLWLSFWEHVTVLPGSLGRGEVVPMLGELHAVLADFPADGPVLDIALGDVRAFLRRPNDMLSTVEMQRLSRAFDAVAPVALACEPARRIHGDAHPGNVWRTSRGWLWADFEETMRGPAEWDAACAYRNDRPEDDTSPAFDEARLRAMFELRRLQGVAWYALLAERFPPYRERVRAKLAELRPAR